MTLLRGRTRSIMRKGLGKQEGRVGGGMKAYLV